MDFEILAAVDSRLFSSEQKPSAKASRPPGAPPVLITMQGGEIVRRKIASVSKSSDTSINPLTFTPISSSESVFRGETPSPTKDPVGGLSKETKKRQRVEQLSAEQVDEDAVKALEAMKSLPVIGRGRPLEGTAGKTRRASGFSSRQNAARVKELEQDLAKAREKIARLTSELAAEKATTTTLRQQLHRIPHVNR